jgi:hypothetical protein
MKHLQPKKNICKNWGDIERNPRVQRNVCKCKERPSHTKSPKRSMSVEKDQYIYKEVCKEKNI